MLTPTSSAQVWFCGAGWVAVVAAGLAAGLCAGAGLGFAAAGLAACDAGAADAAGPEATAAVMSTMYKVIRVEIKVFVTPV